MDCLTDEERAAATDRIERLLECYATDTDRIHELEKKGLVASSELQGWDPWGGDGDS